MNSVFFQFKKWCKSFPITAAIVAICVVVWLCELIFGNRFFYAGVFEPYLATLGFQPWRFITSLFMHDNSSPLHLLCNMWAFVMTGPIFERFFGPKKYLIIYFGSGILGNIVFAGYYFIFQYAPFASNYGIDLGYAALLNPVVSLGASGCIFGLFIGLVLIYKRLGIDAKALIGMLILNLFIGFMPGLGVAWQAHVGGILGGFLFTKLAMNNKLKW
ncbi:MAG: rhomboid family intramembrane serine protease [Candidatus Ancillula sp.]|jgi:membrane associated rhomboid family serine protease|nr:rhomboid family intramembrane serine protease [Candidatus Ancillula sp.]